MIQQHRIIILLPLAAALTGCSFLWDAINGGGLKSDIHELLMQNEMQIELTNCHMIDKSRAGCCEFTTTASNIEHLVKVLKLVPIVDRSNLIISNSKQTCALATKFKSGSSTIYAWKIANRPQQLKLSNGSAFEYLILFFDTASGTACLQVCYSYG